MKHTLIGSTEAQASLPCLLCGATAESMRRYPGVPCCEDGALTAEEYTALYVEQPRVVEVA